ncbi:MAG TPA: MEDS domain-containing protein [Mycobacteriales bacterium]|nr:MEDS domain-containing protein [Mycobacteriales bacterium]
MSDPVWLADGDHAVRFYELDDEIVGVVAGYLTAALREQQAIVVIALDAHRDALRATIAASDIDIESALTEGRLVLLDATATLSRFMVRDLPDPQLFDEVVGGIVRDAAAGGRHVRAFGEMVTVLWEAGNVAAAMAVEELWNDLQAAVPMSLFCAYPLPGKPDAAARAALADVCRLHNREIARSPGAADAEVTRWFAGNAHGPRSARRFVEQTLTAWGCTEEVVADCLLVVSELTTNAVRHAASEFTVSLSREDETIEVVVGDTSVRAPAARGQDELATDGRGLPLVAGSAYRWGHREADNGKLVWAHVTASGQRAG